MHRNFTIHVTTRSSIQAVIPQPDGSLKVMLQSAPVDGRANDELIELLADYFDVPKTRISIKHGLTSRKKLVTIQSIKNPK